MNPHQRTRANELLTVSVLTALFLLLGIGAMVWAVRGGALTPPTPTPTTTPRPASTPTADFRATRIAEDMLTQVAFSVELATAAARQLAGATTTPTGVAVVGENVVLLPAISHVDAALATAIAAAIAETLEPDSLSPFPDASGILPDSPLATPEAPISAIEPTPTGQEVQLPIIDQGGATPTWTPIPPSDVIPVEAPSATPTETWTPSPTFTPEPPTATATPISTPTPTIPFSVQSLAAQVAGGGDVGVRVGPSTLYTQTATIPSGTSITLLNRDHTGEWIWFCCVPGTSNPGWIRSANVRPNGNPTLVAPRETANPDDAVWLAERAPDQALTPIPTSAPAGDSDFPMLRVDKRNSGRVVAVPQLPYGYAWPQGGQAGVAGQAYTSAAIVSGQSVIAASADGHLYAFDRDTGSQRWRFYLGEQVRVAPMATGSMIVVISTTGRLTALVDQGQSAAVLFQRDFNMDPHGGILSSANRLIFTGRQDDGEHLWILEASTGNTLQNVALGSALFQMPAVGAQLVYVTGDVVRAIDLFTGSTVWQWSSGATFTAPPLYMSPGPNTIAELYVTDDQGRVHALDANNGSQLWTASINGTATSLAANDSLVFAAGNGILRALVRQEQAEGQLLWQAGLPGSAPGGVIVDSGRVLSVTEGGSIQVFDANTGAVGVADLQVGALGGGAAVSAPYVFIPTQSGILYAIGPAN